MTGEGIWGAVIVPVHYEGVQGPQKNNDATAYKNSLCNGTLLDLWQQFGDESRMCVGQVCVKVWTWNTEWVSKVKEKETSITV